MNAEEKDKRPNTIVLDLVEGPSHRTAVLDVIWNSRKSTSPMMDHTLTFSFREGQAQSYKSPIPTYL